MAVRVTAAAVGLGVHETRLQWPSMTVKYSGFAAIVGAGPGGASADCQGWVNPSDKQVKSGQLADYVLRVLRGTPAAVAAAAGDAETGAVGAAVDPTPRPATFSGTELARHLRLTVYMAME